MFEFYLFIACPVCGHMLTLAMANIYRLGDSRRTGGWTLLTCQVENLLRGQVLDHFWLDQV
jgi:hypothetical protein